ncbi:hypothetical protein F5Y18DRAFT_268219 [Xylariaceae sp. FL1019]|nr:hypothetical protein F5Y18DRAFT_268219 [Xylariaceae sp. FL1019]
MSDNIVTPGRNEGDEDMPDVCTIADGELSPNYLSDADDDELPLYDPSMVQLSAPGGMYNARAYRAGLSAGSTGIPSGSSEGISGTQDVGMTSTRRRSYSGLASDDLPALELEPTFSDMNSDWSDNTNDGVPQVSNRSFPSCSVQKLMSLRLQGTVYRKVSRNQGRNKHFVFPANASVADIKRVVGNTAGRMTRRFPGYEVEVEVWVFRHAPLPGEEVVEEESSEDQEGGDENKDEGGEEKDGDKA